MPRKVFSYGTIAEPEDFNAGFGVLLFDDADLIGHQPKITDASLSSVAGNIKPEWQTFRDELKITAGVGLGFTYTSGTVRLANGTMTTVSAGSGNAIASSTSYAYIDTAGTVQVATVVPVLAAPLAQIVASGSAITSIVDLRVRRAGVTPRPNSVRVIGGQGDEGDLTISGTTTLSRGIYSVRNLNIQAGANVTIGRGAQIFCSGTATIAGTVTVTQSTIGGGVVSIGNTLAAQLLGGGMGGSGLGAGSGFSGGSTYPFTQLVGSGGASGRVNTSTYCEIAPGGDGGGYFVVEAAGAITCSGTILAKGGNAGVGVDGGDSNDISGGGGGSGGLIWLKSAVSVTVTAAATLDVRGGNGSNAVKGIGLGAVGGCGGGGGYVILNAPSVSQLSSSILLTGGTVGTDVSSSGNGGLRGGAGGGFGGAGGSCPNGGANSARKQAGSAGQLLTFTFTPL